MDRFVVKTKKRSLEDFKSEDNPSIVCNVSKFKYLFDEFYKLISIDGSKLTASCQNCPKVIIGSTSSSGNLLSHIKVSILLLIIILCNTYS
jgi:hypothetical protein